MKHRSAAGLAGLVLALLLADPATAAPVTVNLRVEGPTRTLFEGPVTTDVRPFQFTGDPVAHQCDGTTLGGMSPQPAPTRGAALMATGLAVTGTWSSFGPSFKTIDGEDVDFNGTTFAYLAEYKNNVFASLGSCGDTIQVGDDVLYAYGPAPNRGSRSRDRRWPVRERR